MTVEKAALLNTETGDEVRVLFNPDEYTHNLSNNFAEIGIPGLRTPPIQYVGGQATELTMELFVDTYEVRSDVRAEVRRLTQFLDHLPTTGAPPVLLFSWGTFNFECVLVRVDQRFTMFLDDGTPVRATLNVTFKEFEPVEVDIQSGVFVGPPTIRTLAAGENLSSIAGELLGDPRDWRKIADANGIENPRLPSTGAAILVPAKGS